MGKQVDSLSPQFVDREIPTDDQGWEALAIRIKKAVDHNTFLGFGTDEEAIFAVLQPLQGKAEYLEKIKAAYAKLTNRSQNALQEDIIDEMSGSELDYALNLLKVKPPKEGEQAEPAEESNENELFDDSNCPRRAPGSEHAEPVCQNHTFFANAMKKAVDNMEKVQTPYTKQLADFYDQFFPNFEYQTEPKITLSKSNVELAITSNEVLVIPNFSLELEQNTEIEKVAHYQSGSNTIYLNEFALSENRINPQISEIENTLYHEGIHLLEDKVTERNQDKPDDQKVQKALDTSLRKPAIDVLAAASVPFWRAFYAKNPTTLRVFGPGGANPTSRQKVIIDMTSSGMADKMAGEAIARVEAKIYEFLSQNKEFTTADLQSWDQWDWLGVTTYWQPIDHEDKIEAFLNDNSNQALIQPVIAAVRALQQDFMNRRPGSEQASSQDSEQDN